MCFLFSHEYADILKTIVDVESFQYKECILLFREVVEPVVFLLSQNLWLIREVRSDCLKKCRNYVKVTVYAWRILVWNQGYGQRSPIRSCSADEASPERAESWEYEVEGLSKVILGGWSWAQVILFSIFFFFVVEKRNITYSNAPVCWHTRVHTHTHPFFAYTKNETTVQNVLQKYRTHSLLTGLPLNELEKHFPGYIFSNRMFPVCS